MTRDCPGNHHGLDLTEALGQVLDGLDVKTDLENTISEDAYTALRNIQHRACPTTGGKNDGHR